MGCWNECVFNRKVLWVVWLKMYFQSISTNVSDHLFYTHHNVFQVLIKVWTNLFRINSYFEPNFLPWFDSKCKGLFLHNISNIWLYKNVYYIFYWIVKYQVKISITVTRKNVLPHRKTTTSITKPLNKLINNNRNRKQRTTRYTVTDSTKYKR